WRGTPRSLLNFYASAPCIALCAFFHKAGILSLFAAHLSPRQSTRELLTELYTVATAAVDPAPALAARLERLDRGAQRRWILALGKAAMPMARAAVETLARWGMEPAGGLVVAPALQPAPHPSIRVVAGDHPEPGPGSLAAADALTRAATEVAGEDEVWV